MVCKDSTIIGRKNVQANRIQRMRLLFDSIWRRNADLVPRRYLGLLIAVAAFILAVGQVSAGVVTLDVGRSTATSDTDTISPARPTTGNGQVWLRVHGMNPDSQGFTLKVIGLSNGDYDVYQDGSGPDRKTSSDLENGIEFSLTGSPTPLKLIRCLRKCRPAIVAECNAMSKSQAPEAARVAATLRDAGQWVRSAIDADESAGSTDIVIAPAGDILSVHDTWDRVSRSKAAAGAARAAWLLQSARDRMCSVVRDRDLRNRALIALTPVELFADVSAAEGHLRIDVQVANYCDIPIDGDISVAVPNGWKLDGKLPAFKQLVSGTMFRTTVALAPVAVDTAQPMSIGVAANLTVSQGDYLAKLKLRTNAR